MSRPQLNKLVFMLAIAGAAPAFAADVTVTPTNTRGWIVTDYRGTLQPTTAASTSATIAQIDAVHAPAGETGSFHFATTDSSGKADYTLQTNLTFGQLTAFSYDYYRSSSSTTDKSLAPALRLYYDADGSTATTSDQGYMIFEPVYNDLASTGNGNLAAPTDAWVHQDAISGKFWQRYFSPSGTAFNGPNQIFQTLTDWKTPGMQGNGDLLSDSSRILAINFGVGSGWSGTFDGAVDHVTLGINGASTTYNFETAAVTAVPEPSTYALLGLGLGAVGWVARRRNR